MYSAPTPTFPTAPGCRLGRGLDRPRAINDPDEIPMRAINHVGALENLGTVALFPVASRSDHWCVFEH